MSVNGFLRQMFADTYERAVTIGYLSVSQLEVAKWTTRS
jgi:hypothetical protein